MSRQGSQKLAVLLCKFSDSASIEPHPHEFYSRFFALRGSGGLNDYWIAASRGAIDLDGTEVFGWRTINQTRDEFLAARAGRSSKIQGAIDLFPEVNTPDYAGVIAVFNVDMGDSGTQGGVMVSPGALSVTFLAHEIGHLFGLDHSFDESDRRTNTWSAPGEYFDGYDVMSAMNVYTTLHGDFGPRGPLLCVANLDIMGWLPTSRVWSPTKGNSSAVDEIDLVALGSGATTGYLGARVGGLYVEFRTADGWDAGIPRAGVLIHRLYGSNAVIVSPDKTFQVKDWQPDQVYGATDTELGVIGGVQVRIISFDLRRGTARISLRVVAKRIDRDGPSRFLGAVESGGDGFVILKGRVIPIPPRGLSILFVTAVASLAVVLASVATSLRGLFA